MLLEMILIAHLQRQHVINKFAQSHGRCDFMEIDKILLKILLLINIKLNKSQVDNRFKLLFDFKSRISFRQWILFRADIFMVSAPNDLRLCNDMEIGTLTRFNKCSTTKTALPCFTFFAVGVRWCYIFIHIGRFQFA